MEITIRKAGPEDRDRVIWVESKSTPGLRYVAQVWDLFLNDATGDWSVVELDGEVVACGKYTVLPDGSVWLETLRVIPERQRLGIGKRLYEHWLDLARRQGVPAVRMYTGLTNRASKGLAERFGLQVAGLFKESRRPCPETVPAGVPEFTLVRDGDEAASLLMPHGDAWSGFLVMNRTYYAFTPALCRYLAERGMVYAQAGSGSVVVLGARFMPEDALHIGVLAGDLRACLDFAAATCRERRASRLNVQLPPAAVETHEVLTQCGFQTQAADFIVMERRLATPRTANP
jgi:GNAT superfamily N-acetyltransferase